MKEAFTVLMLTWKNILTLSVLFLSLILITKSMFTLPITGITLLIYFLIVWVISLWITFMTLQAFLQHNKPYNLEQFIKFQNNDEKLLNKLSHNLSCVKQLTADIDKNFIRNWFTYISPDYTFNNESKVVIEDVLRKMLNVMQLSVENVVVIHCVLNLYLKHLKEFRRSLKRKEKYGGKISELYRYSHMCSNSAASKEYFLHQLTRNLLNHFINWELSNSLPCRILLSTVAKTVTNYALNLLSNPTFINYHVLNICASEDKKIELKLKDYNRIKLRNLSDDYNNCDNVINSNKKLDISNLINTAATTSKTTEADTVDGGNKALPEYKTDTIIIVKQKKVETISPIKLNQQETKKTKKNYEQLKNEDVKIYEPKSSCKTWYDSFDLESVTLGQDTLDMLNATETDKASHSYEKNAWEYGIECFKEEASSPVAAAKSLLDEVKHITSIEGIKTSIKPISDVTVHTFHNIKDLQETTVNNVVKDVSQVTTNALHKIGGLQDEAAGVVEGILDFGRARIRKGLRLTGLQDNNAEDSVKHVDNIKIPAVSSRHLLAKKNIVKLPHVESQEKANNDSNNETVWINPLQDNDKFVDNPSTSTKFDVIVPTIMMHSHESSPDLEYEETADLATSIAKLRSLLEQKSSESNMSTPSALSPMPPDDFSNKILLENDNNGIDALQTDGVMPNFYKFCAKTATGVIKNIKTALPGNVADYDMCDSANKWMFVKAHSSEDDLFVRMNKLLSERKVFCTVDTAYEAIDSLVPLQQIEENLYTSNIVFEDELDYFEVKLPITKTLLDILCELLADTKSTPFKQEPVIRSILLLLGNYIEENVTSKVNFYTNYLCSNAKIPSQSEIKTLTLDVEEFVEALLTGIPNYTKYILGEDIVKQAISLFVISLQTQKINQDVIMQIFEIISLKLIEGSKQMTPISF